MRILHTVEFYAPNVGGAQLVVQQISERLARRGHEICVATTRLPERKFTELNGVEIRGFDVAGSQGRFISGRDCTRYQAFLREPGFDVMMNFACQQWATDLAYATIEETRARRVNVIVPCGYSALSDRRTLRWENFTDYFNHIVPRAIPLYDAAIYNSTQYQDYQFGVQAGFRNSIIIPNAADAAEFGCPPVIDFREKYGIRTPFLALCVANFYRGKGQDRVIDCVRAMQRSDMTMVFIGQHGDDLPRLQRCARGLNNVRFLTGVPRAEVVAGFHAADIFLFGSYIEASPVVIIEAKASRTPFVSTDCGNVADFRGGVVCAPADMARHANRILDDAALRQQLADDGWQEWKQVLTWDAVIDRFEETYSTLLRAKRHHLPLADGFFLPVPAQAADPKSANVKRPVAAILFSKDRAIQLEATLQSFALHCADPEHVRLHVLYTTSSPRHEKQYRRLMGEFPDVHFVREADFRAQTLEVVKGHDAVLFLVDDNIFVRRFEVAAAMAALDQHPESLGFSFRLGQNTTWCYSHNAAQSLPTFTSVEGPFLKYRWPKTDFDFGYPLEVSSSLYRSRDILPLLNRLSFRNPNTLEAVLAAEASKLAAVRPELLCFPLSVAFCIPLNRVQKVYRNRAGASFGYSIRALTRRFEKGHRLDVASLANHIPTGCHQEVPVGFVRRVRLAPQRWKGWPERLSPPLYLALQLWKRCRHNLGRCYRLVRPKRAA